METCNVLDGRDPYFLRTGVRRGSTMVPLDRALVSSYRLSIVTMPLPKRFDRNSQCKYLGVQSVPPFEGKWWVVGGPNWYYRVAVGQNY